jgi:hypothetical protein
MLVNRQTDFNPKGPWPVHEPVRDGSAGGSWSGRRLGEKALTDLREQAKLLFSCGVPPYEVSHAVLRLAELHRQFGADLPPDITLQVMRELPGLAEWNPLADWQTQIRQLPANIADSIELPDDAEHDRRRRAYVLADWLRSNAGSALAERIVCAAHEIALQEVNHGTDAG